MWDRSQNYWSLNQGQKIILGLILSDSTSSTNAPPIASPVTVDAREGHSLIQGHECVVSKTFSFNSAFGFQIWAMLSCSICFDINTTQGHHPDSQSLNLPLSNPLCRPFIPCFPSSKNLSLQAISLSSPQKIQARFQIRVLYKQQQCTTFSVGRF